MPTTPFPALRAFSLVEVMIVVVVIGILAAIVVPNFAGVSNEARSSAAQSAVSGVRASVAAYRAQALLKGQSPFPTLAQLTTLGTVMQQELPANPYSGLKAIQQVSASQAASRAVSAETTYGWNYYYDNEADPPAAILYLNSTHVTTVSDGAGGYRTANQL